MDKTDVLVIGGGPAGTTAATLLAKRGWQVTLFEKDLHPRFHIGESLLPGNLPILERLGVLPQVRDIGVCKPGADFTCSDGTVQTFPFARALGNTPSHAYQVRRDEFDQLLFNNSISNGVSAGLQHEVQSVNRVNGEWQVQYQNQSGTVASMQARFLVDASGRHGFLARHFKWRSRNPKHSSAAVFGHFKQVTPRDGKAAGNISVYWFDHGWLWMIPLRDDVMSIGAVCWPDYLRSRSVDLETFLGDTINSIPDARERFVNAELCSPVSATGNYSYRSTNLSGPGYVLLGDAYAFIDPVFSSGVYLAMNSAERSIGLCEAWLRNDAGAYRRACADYRRTINSKINAFSWFIYRFTTPTMRDLFRNPRNDWQVEQAVVSMLAGDGDGSADIRKRLRLFKVIYYMYWSKRLKQSLLGWLRKRRNQRLDFNDETILS